MPPFRANENQLLRITKGKKDYLKNLKEGEHLNKATGLAIDDLIERACVDRFKLAKQMCKEAENLQNANIIGSRIIIARAYYSMYHAIRAIIFFCDGGDDNEAHSELPKHIPHDFPSQTLWENKLKTARLERNKADYEPYPKSDKKFQQAAANTLEDAKNLLRLSRGYLKRKGIRL